MTNHPIERETHPMVVAAAKAMLAIRVAETSEEWQRYRKPESWRLFERDARAALSALRDLTPDVVEEGVGYWHTHDEFLDDEVRGQFVAMLNTIIGERG